MGKENKNNKYQDVYSMNGAKAKRAPQKADHTSTYVLIAIVALLAVSLFFVIFSDSGIKDRSTVVVSSDNYEVTASMLPYYENSAYSNMFSQYYSMYYSYLGDANSAYQYAAQMMSNYTLDDFFDSAYASAKEIVVLCDAAKAAGLSLTDEDKASIDEALASFEQSFASVFGSGVKEKDVRKAMELELLAGKYYDKFHEEKEDAITDADIQKYIEDNKADFYVASYLKFDVSLSAEDYVDLEGQFENDKALADKYLPLIANAKTEAEFKNQVIRYVVDRDFDAAVQKHMTEDLMPEDAALATIKQDSITKIYANLVSGETTEEEEGTATDYMKAVGKICDTLETACSEALNALEGEQAYTATPEGDAAKWLIADTTKQYETKSFDNSTEEDYAHAVYMLTAPLHISDEETVNVGHILVAAREGTATDKEMADAEKEAKEILNTYLAGEKTKDAFEKLGEEKTDDSSVFYTGVTRGKMVEAFDSWIFSEDRKEVGETDIVKTEFGYHVMYWNGKGDNTSVAAAKTAIVDEQYQKFVEEKAESLKLNEKYAQKHTAQTETEAAA